jgi:hypothetical protein
MPFGRRLQAIMAGLYRLIEFAGDPYRPERHYMRGPGPKWRAKHSENGRL